MPGRVALVGKYAAVGLLFTLASLFTATRLLAEARPQQGGPNQEQALKLLSSQSWRERGQGVQMLRLIPPHQLSLAVKKKLEDLLRTETGQLWLSLEGKLPPPKHPGLTREQYEEGAGEARAEYLSYLFGLVLGLHDPKNLPVLLSAVPQPCEADLDIARYGAMVIPLVSLRLKSLQRFRAGPGGFDGAVLGPQQAMADILTKMMRLDQQKELKPPLTPSDYATIRQMLRPLLESPERYVRLYAAIALARAGDVRDSARFRETFMRFLEDPIPGARTIGLERMMSMTDVRSIPLAKVRELATSDPYHYRRGVLGDGPVVYPVREAARKVIKKFSEPSSPLAPE